MRTLIFAAWFAVPATAFAGGFIIPQENARDLALSSSTVALQTGAEALFINTAELAGQDGLSVSLSGEILVNRTTWYSGDESSSLIPQYSTPPSGAIGFGMHLNQDMAIGVAAGIDVPAGGQLVWPNGWPGQEFIQTVDQKVYRIGVGVGFQPIPHVKVGASFLRYQATEKLHQTLDFLDHEGDANLGMAGGANTFGIGIGIHVPNIPLTIGAQYTHSGTIDLDGDVHFTNVPPAFTPMVHDQSVTEKLKIPNVLEVGAAYAVAPNLHVMAAYTFERWSVYTEDKFVGSDGFTVTVPRTYNNAHVIRAGGEWKMTGTPVTARLGGLRSISDQPSETVSPTLTDGKSWALSVGAGVDIMPTLRVDFGYQHAWFDTVTASGDAFMGSYKTHVDLFSLGINWRSDLGLAH